MERKRRKINNSASLNNSEQFSASFNDLGYKFNIVFRVIYI